MKGFNGYYGCYYCEIKGRYCKRKNHVYFPDPTGARKRREFALRDPGNVPHLATQVCLHPSTLNFIDTKLHHTEHQ